MKQMDEETQCEKERKEKEMEERKDVVNDNEGKQKGRQMCLNESEEKKWNEVKNVIVRKSCQADRLLASTFDIFATRLFQL